MLKTSLAVLVTAAACFGIAAATGLASSDRSARTINLKVGDTVVQASNNFHCQVLSRKQIAPVSTLPLIVTRRRRSTGQ